MSVPIGKDDNRLIIQYIVFVKSETGFSIFRISGNNSTLMGYFPAGHIMRTTFFIAPLVTALVLLTGRAYGEDDSFLNAALDPSFHRDAHGTGMGVSRTGNAGLPDGQSTGFTFRHIGVASNIWNNEHNQVLFGMQYGSRAFDNRLTLPGGIVMPERVDRASASVVYKHITSGDWSFTQAVQLSRTGIGSLSGPGTDGLSLAGLAAHCPEPGYAWLFGYILSRTGDQFSGPVPLIVYLNGASEEFSYVAGFPLFGTDYSPHPDWMFSLSWALGGMPSASIFYKVAARNFARLGFGEENWSYRLPLPFE